MNFWTGTTPRVKYLLGILIFKEHYVDLNYKKALKKQERSTSVKWAASEDV